MSATHLYISYLRPFFFFARLVKTYTQIMQIVAKKYTIWFALRLLLEKNIFDSILKVVLTHNTSSIHIDTLYTTNNV